MIRHARIIDRSTQVQTQVSEYEIGTTTFGGFYERISCSFCTVD